jgi:glyoxalase family protein
MLELVANDAALTWEVPAWGPIPVDCAIRGLHGITIWADSSEDWEGLLSNALGLHLVEENVHALRYSAQGGGLGAHVVIRVLPTVGHGLTTVGFVDHTAFRVPGRELANWRPRLSEYTDALSAAENHLYFCALRFEGPQRVRLELASDGPGVTVDEAPTELGTHLVLPPWLEARRPDLERRLPLLRLPGALR